MPDSLVQEFSDTWGEDHVIPPDICEAGVKFREKHPGDREGYSCFISQLLNEQGLLHRTQFYGALMALYDDPHLTPG